MHRHTKKCGHRKPRTTRRARKGRKGRKGRKSRKQRGGKSTKTGRTAAGVACDASQAGCIMGHGVGGYFDFDGGRDNGVFTSAAGNFLTTIGKGTESVAGKIGNAFKHIHIPKIHW